MNTRLALALLLLVLASCSDDASPPTAGLQVMVTTDVLADVVEDVVGEAGTVVGLMEQGGDPHAYSPTAEQAARVRSADLVVANGLGLEAGLTELLDSAAEETTVLELAARVDPLPYGEHHEDEAGHDHGDQDPHFALDPLRMADAIDLVAESLAQVDPAVDWRQRATDVRAELEDLHRDIEEELSGIPPERRKLVSNHHALAYFADRYDFEVVGTVIPGGDTLAEPSASYLAELAEMLRREQVSTIFADAGSSTDLAATLAAEVGAEIEVLYTGSLGPDGSGAETYPGMMRTNAATIAAALGG